MLRVIVCVHGGIINDVYSLKHTFVHFLCFIKIKVCPFIMIINEYLQNKKYFCLCLSYCVTFQLVIYNSILNME